MQWLSESLDLYIRQPDLTHNFTAVSTRWATHHKILSFLHAGCHSIQISLGAWVFDNQLKISLDLVLNILTKYRSFHSQRSLDGIENWSHVDFDSTAQIWCTRNPLLLDHELCILIQADPIDPIVAVEGQMLFIIHPPATLELVPPRRNPRRYMEFSSKAIFSLFHTPSMILPLYLTAWLVLLVFR